jgi:glycosyltransferase involved in cell wall biosynthesis
LNEFKQTRGYAASARYDQVVDSSSRPRFSLIIPAYNEEHYLPRLLDSVDVARNGYSKGPEAVEVIVADNGSIDGTAAFAAARGCRVVRVEKRIIAASRNGGAAAARGEILAFIDADSEIHPRTFDEIDKALATGRYIAGATGLRMERWSLGIAATYAIMVPMVILMRMDTGVVFCRRHDFETVGGYNEERLFGEDVQFLWDLRRLGRCRALKADGFRRVVKCHLRRIRDAVLTVRAEDATKKGIYDTRKTALTQCPIPSLGKGRKQGLVRVRAAKALGSTRKWDQHGEWHYITQVFRLAWSVIRSPSARPEFARRYWYGEDRRDPP